MQWVCHNGLFLPAAQPLFTASNRGFRYGDGLFETASFYNGRLRLAGYHFERLYAGLKLLNITTSVTPDTFAGLIAALCEKNGCTAAARIRLALYRDEANQASFVIEATPLAEAKMRWEDNGWSVGIYPFARKSCDAFANLKSANYLTYLMAARYAQEAGVDECIVLNTNNRLCDGSKTNLFFIQEGEIYTPSLSEGCVAGVMRRAVIDFLKATGYNVHQKGITEEDVLRADQVFVTNAIEGLRWVRRFKDRVYEHGVLKNLHHDFMAALAERAD